MISWKLSSSQYKRYSLANCSAPETNIDCTEVFQWWISTRIDVDITPEADNQKYPSHKTNCKNKSIHDRKITFPSPFLPFYTKLPALHKKFFVIMDSRLKSWKKETFKLKECQVEKPARCYHSKHVGPKHRKGKNAASS